MLLYKSAPLFPRDKNIEGLGSFMVKEERDWYSLVGYNHDNIPQTCKDLDVCAFMAYVLMLKALTYIFLTLNYYVQLHCYLADESIMHLFVKTCHCK